MTRKSIDTDLRIALFPGSFNPFTKGHMSILERFLPLFDKIIIGIGINISKDSEKDEIKKRLSEIQTIVSEMPSVEVMAYSGLTVNTARDVRAGFIIKGVRDTADYEYERRMAEINRSISGIETLFMFALPEYASLSSSVVRELSHYGEDISQYLP